jgi:hypothetical protein
MDFLQRYHMSTLNIFPVAIEVDLKRPPIYEKKVLTC